MAKVKNNNRHEENLLKTYDCSPFEINLIGKNKSNDERQIINNLVPKLCELEIKPFKISGKPLEKDDNPLAYFDYQQNCWCAGRNIGQTWITLDKKTYHIQIDPRFGMNFLGKMLEDIFDFKSEHLRRVLADNDISKNWDPLMQYIIHYIWIAKFSKADRYGLPRKMVKRSFQGDKIKGHLNLRRSIKPLLSKREVVSEYYERDYDDNICKIIYQAYKILRRKKSLYGIPPIPEIVEESIHQLDSHYRQQDLIVRPKDYQSIRYKSIYQSWKPLVDFSWEKIIQAERLGLQSANTKEESVFIDMAEIWEQFLRKTLEKELQADGWHCWSEEERCISTYEEMFYIREIIPDIVLEKGNDVLVFDAKYKRMKGEKSDVDRSDFFQIHTYIQYFKSIGKNVICGGLLYPISNPDFDFKRAHSNTLFGLNLDDSKTKFIVDGIVCEEWKDDELEKNKQAFLDRIKRCINPV